MAPFNVSATCLLIVDMQNDYMLPDGYFARRGANTEPIRRIVPTIRRLLLQARTVGMPIIFTRFTLLDGLPDIPDLHANALGRHFRSIEKRLVRGTKGAEIVDELAPRPGEVIIPRLALSAFYQTELELILRRLGIKTLIITGYATQACVLHTAYDGFARDFDIIMVRDGVGTFYAALQEPVLEIVDVLLGHTLTADEILSDLTEALVEPLIQCQD